LWFIASLGKESRKPYLKKPFTKIGLVEWLGEGPEVPVPGKKKKKHVAVLMSRLLAYLEISSVTFG
jgi:hypothetical protein